VKNQTKVFILGAGCSAECGYETLQLEIISVIESLNQLRESPDYELCQLSGQKAGVLDELASERARLLDQESAELEQPAERIG
jgi:hypothetical protein